MNKNIETKETLHYEVQKASDRLQEVEARIELQNTFIHVLSERKLLVSDCGGKYIPEQYMALLDEVMSELMELQQKRMELIKAKWEVENKYYACER